MEETKETTEAKENTKDKKTKKKSKKPNTKPVPVIITLGAALVSCIMSIFEQADLSLFVERLLIVVIIFMVMGTIIKMILDYSFKTMDDPTLIEQLENQELKEEEPESVESENDSE